MEVDDGAAPQQAAGAAEAQVAAATGRSVTVLQSEKAALERRLVDAKREQQRHSTADPATCV